MKNLAQVIAEASPEEEGYYTVVIPPGKSEWQHPDMVRTGGVFDTEAEAHAWAKKKIPGVKYTVKWIEGVEERRRLSEASLPTYGITPTQVLQNLISRLEASLPPAMEAFRQLRDAYPTMKDAEYLTKNLRKAKAVVDKFVDRFSDIEYALEDTRGALPQAHRRFKFLIEFPWAGDPEKVIPKIVAHAKANEKNLDPGMSELLGELDTHVGILKGAVQRFEDADRLDRQAVDIRDKAMEKRANAQKALADLGFEIVDGDIRKL